MKFSAASTVAALAFCLGTSSSSTNAFTPISSQSSTTRTITSSKSETQLKVMTDSEIFDISTGRAYSNTYGRSGMGYREGGRGFYPSSTNSGYANNMNGYGNNKIEGGSRRTFDTAYSDSSTVQLETDGRPLDCKIEIWEGPDNTPAKMKLWSEDGAERPWTAGFATFNNVGRGGSVGSSMTIDNKAAIEFPLYANAVQNNYVGTSRRNTVRVDGNGAQKSFTLPAGPCVVEIWSEGFPYFANIEVWDGPNNIRQSAEVYADSGFDRPWSAVIETPTNTGARGGTIQIRNPGPLTYPILVSVEPLGGGYGRGGGYY